MSVKTTFLAMILSLLLIPALGWAQDEVPPGAGESPLPVPQAGPGEGLESAIDPGMYTLGPGDVLQISIWGPEQHSWQVPISLEGTVLIPTVGVVRVVGLSLTDAKEAVTGRILDAYRDTEVSITLVRLRRFQVHVLGQVARPGTYLATAVDRVSQTINWAGGFLEGASRRRVLVENQGETRHLADMVLFLRHGKTEVNPLLTDGDIVFVPYRGKTFSIFGAVHASGSYHRLDGDTFSKALELAGGMTNTAAPDIIELVRYREESPEPLRFSITSSGEIHPMGEASASLTPAILGVFEPEQHLLESSRPIRYPDFELRVDDLIFVRSVPAERRHQLVQILGEVTYPGYYTIQKDHTTLLELVDLAGGLTEDAFLAEAKLIRSQAIRLDDREYERLQKMVPADMNEDEYAYFKTRSRENPGRMVIDFKALLEDGDRTQDVLLVRDDRVVIPSRKDFVSVIGMVQYPGNVLFKPGLRAGEYVGLAGGLAKDADKKKARVIRATGGEWVPLGDAREIYAGDTIWMPEKAEGKFWQQFRDFVTVTTQILAIYIVIDNATR